MDRLKKLFLSQMHLLIIAYTAWGIYVGQEDHTFKLQQLKQQIPILQSKSKDLKKKIELAKSFEKNLETSRQRVEEIAQQIEKVQKQLPNSISDTEILDYFASEAESLNIKNVFLTPLEEELKGFYYAKRYSFKGYGTFLQFLIFFERISDNQRLFNVTSFNLKQAKDGNKGRFQMVNLETIIEVFRYNPAYRVEREAPATVEKKTNGKKKKK